MNNIPTATVSPRDKLREELGIQSPAEIGYINALFYGKPGCLAGDTLIPMNRAGAGKLERLDWIVKMFNAGTASNGRRWDLNIPTKVQTRDNDGFIRLGEVKYATFSGEKETYTIQTKSGIKVKATSDHEFLTPTGWIMLEGLGAGSDISIKVVGRTSHTEKSYYPDVSVPYHPLRKSRNRVPLHRLIYEAHLNELSYEEYVWRLHNGEIRGLQFLSLSSTIHHKDEDVSNNAIENLEEFSSRADHLKHHGDKKGYQHFGLSTDFDPIVDIKRYGGEETYDLSLDEPHNFIANGVVAHNCGKTYLLGTAQDSPHTKPLLILDVEGGTLTLRKKPDIDVVQVRSIKEIVDWHKRLLEENDVLGYKTVGIDSGSELAKLDMREIMLEAKQSRPDINVDVPSMREWGVAGEHMRRIVRAFRDLPMNFIMTSHVSEQTDELNRVIFQPMFSGKLRVEVPGFLDIVGFMHLKIEDDVTTRILQLSATNKVTAKDRTGSLGEIVENPTIPMLWSTIHS